MQMVRGRKLRLMVLSVLAMDWHCGSCLDLLTTPQPLSDLTIDKYLHNTKRIAINHALPFTVYLRTT
jgi:hypothetical protein